MFFKKLLKTTRPKALVLPDENRSVTLQGREISYVLRQSVSRYLRLKIDPEHGLLVSAPRYMSQRHIDDFIEQKWSWIAKHLDAEKKRHPKSHIVSGLQIQLLGVVKTLELIDGSRQKFVIFTDDERITIQAPSGVLVKQTALKKVLEKYCRRRFEEYLKPRLQELSQLMEVSYKRVTVRAQKSRWGSCTAHNDLNFNWRLVFMPRAVADYVLMHELTHTVHHNHSKRFYNMLQKYCPDYRNLRRKLKNTVIPF